MKRDQIHLATDHIAKDPKLLQAIAIVSSRYVIDEEPVKKEKEKLFRNPRALKIVADPEREIIHSVEKTMLRWVDAFNLRSLNTDLGRK